MWQVGTSDDNPGCAFTTSLSWLIGANNPRGQEDERVERYQIKTEKEFVKVLEKKK